MQKIVINKRYGGFSLSGEALLELRKRGNKYALEETYYGEVYPNSDEVCDYNSNSWLRDIPRDDNDLIKLLEEWGPEKVSGACAFLNIVLIPDGVEWEIEEYDGQEWIAEKHRVWR